jgi:ribosomal protein S18 acetylase RimI-like enzyme/N-acetylglutamate synthase-like GNAT family acetyltransferase
MKFNVRELQDDDDWDFFFHLSFKTMKAIRQFVLDELLKNNPDVDATDDASLLELHRKETMDYFDFSDPKARVFIAEQEDGVRCGYLWMGSRNSKDAWDVEIEQWIYDIVVDPKFYGNGIGKLLLQKAEKFSSKLNRNLGLFVHADNFPAIALYQKAGYAVKQVPVSKVLKAYSEYVPLGDDFIIREIHDDEYGTIVGLEFDQFKKKVEFSIDANLEVEKKLHQEHLEKYYNDEEKHQRFIALSKDGEIIGTIWVGSSGFDKLIAKIHEVTVNSDNQRDKIGDFLVNSEKWANENKFTGIYMLLHSSDPLEVEFFKDRGYKVPGFFMEKRLKSVEN